MVGTTRNNQHLGHQQADQYELVHFDPEEMEKQFKMATHILISTPPSAINGDPILAEYSHLIKQYMPHMSWVGYLSSTGVYGDHQGRWVDESSETKFPGQQARLRLQAEQEWMSLAKIHHIPLHVFRLSGIYGPKRNALARIVEGKNQTVYKKGHYFSRIHVEDIANVLVASIQHPSPFSIYNVSDDKPAPAYVIDEYAASLLKRQLLRVSFDKAILTPMAKEFYSYNRRVSNAKIKKELGVDLSYPTYVEGLNKLYEDNNY